VYRAVRGGVQDVAVKVLNHTENDPRQIAAFEKVHHLSIIPPAHSQHAERASGCAGSLSA